MNSALGQNAYYLCYISAIWEGLLHVTAELTDMVQYVYSLAYMYILMSSNLSGFASIWAVGAIQGFGRESLRL